MDAPLPVSPAMEQATVAACILGIILDEVTALNDRSDLSRCDHSLGSRHLPNRMRQE